MPREVIPSSGRSAAAHRRRTHYVDRSVQRALLVTMVTLEVVLVAAATWQLHRHLNELIEESLFRVHLADAGPMLIELIPEALGVLGVFVAINAIALLIAEAIWSRHANRVVREFATLIDKTRRLDFTGDGETHPQHEVLDKTLAWRARERARFAAIREQVASLETAATAGNNPQSTATALHDLRGLLWPPSTDSRNLSPP